MPNYDYQPADVSDFSGGETDLYINAPVNSAQRLENFFIQDNKKIRTRPGTRLDEDTIDPQVLLGSQRVAKLISFEDDALFVQSLNRLYFRNPVAYTDLRGPDSGAAFQSSLRADCTSHTFWNHHMYMVTDAFEKPIKVFKDDTDTYQLRTAGLPALASTPSASGGAGARSYLYGFAYMYTYMVGSQEFVDVGPVTLLEKTGLLEPSASTVNITSIPVLANALGDNYDTTTIKVAIYRSIDGGTELYYVGEVTNGTTTFNDTTSDADAQLNEPIYTTGDVPDNDPPPMAKYVHTVGNVTYWAHFKVGTEVFKNSYRQSQADDPDSVPEGFEDSLDDEITGFNSVQGIPIIGCKKHIYAVQGIFDEVGRGGPVHQRISDHAGCISNDSFVQAEGSLFWAGRDGFYVTDGNNVKKISDHLNARYLERVAKLGDNKKRIQGKYNATTRMIHWTIARTDQADGTEDCDAIWTLDLRYGISDRSTFHTWYGSDRFWPTAIEVYNDELYRGDKLGYVLKFDETYLTDKRIDPAVDPVDWEEEAIIYRYTSPAVNFGSSGSRKIANKILFSCKNESNVAFDVTAINDDGKVERALTPVRYRRNFVWGDELFVWGNDECVWTAGGFIQIDRRFPAGGLRFNYLQIDIKTAFSNIQNSDVLGNAVIDATAKTVTLVNTATYNWPSDCVGYYIYFSDDSYEQRFKILERTTADVLTVEDNGGSLTSGTVSWQIKGYKKAEILNLNEYSISWAFTSRSYDGFTKGDKGGIGGT